MNECAFCRIVSGEDEAHILYEDERTVAFLDENPAVDGHALVIPKPHREDVLAGDERTAAAVFDTVRTVSRALDAAFDPDGFSVFHSTGPLVGNVEHAHVHVVPRLTDDDVHVSLPRRSLTVEEGERIAADVRARL